MNLHGELLVCELRWIVIDIGHGYVDGCGGVEARMTVIRHQYSQSVMRSMLPIQSHPVNQLSCHKREENTGLE